jgi:RNA polymerase sigma-70 factor (ECF subfamily)
VVAQDPKERTQPVVESAQRDPSEWVDAYGDVLFRWALLRLGDVHQAEEAVQETFRAALGSRDTFGGRASERTWLVSILRHKVVDLIRRRSRERPMGDLTAIPDPLHGRFDARGHWVSGLAEWSASPHDLLERKEFRRVLTRCISDLPPRLAQAFALRELDGLGTGKIRELMGTSMSNVWVMLHRARARLRDCLETRWFSRSDGGDS